MMHSRVAVINSPLCVVLVMSLWCHWRLNALVAGKHISNRWSQCSADHHRVLFSEFVYQHDCKWQQTRERAKKTTRIIDARSTCNDIRRFRVRQIVTHWTVKNLSAVGIFHSVKQKYVYKLIHMKRRQKFLDGYEHLDNLLCQIG